MSGQDVGEDALPHPNDLIQILDQEFGISPHSISETGYLTCCGRAGGRFVAVQVEIGRPALEWIVIDQKAKQLGVDPAVFRQKVQSAMDARIASSGGSSVLP